jgi:hypothetical protein
MILYVVVLSGTTCLSSITMWLLPIIIVSLMQYMYHAKQ